MKRVLFLIGILTSLLFLVACGGKKDFSSMKFNDGVYIGKSEGGEPISYTVVKLEIKDNKIIKSESKFLDSNKNIKDENYGKNIGEKKYKMAQKAVAGMKKYDQLLIEIQNPDEVDAVSGATISGKLFREAVWNALKSAKK